MIAYCGLLEMALVHLSPSYFLTSIMFQAAVPFAGFLLFSSMNNPSCFSVPVRRRPLQELEFPVFRQDCSEIWEECREFQIFARGTGEWRAIPCLHRTRNECLDPGCIGHIVSLHVYNSEAHLRQVLILSEKWGYD